MSKSKADALKIADFVLEKKAKDLVILDVRKISSICDYFVICSGDSERQVKAIYEETLRMSRKNGIKVKHSEVDESCRWMLVDFFDVILHIFLDKARSFYNIEYLWRSAKKINLSK